MSLDPTRLYRLLHVGNPGDVDFYLRVCEGAGDVLEIGAGWGRVSGALARAGHRVWALELDDAMRAAAAQQLAEEGLSEQVTLVAGDMRGFTLGRSFERILVPYCGLFCLADDAEVVQALTAMAAHLAPDGLLALDGYQIVDPDDLEGGDDFEWLCEIHDGDRAIQVHELDVHAPEDRCWKVHYRFEAPGEAPHEQVLHHHYLLRSQLGELLSQAGLTLLGLWGDFEGGPADDEAPHLVVVAGHAEA
ncbi:MAG: class I SAM-dependent methyltransferase [Myxococcales bacterium]|nr:class I SAM-dependent methyltransferase [Myxococcales bacterium]MCB9525232.1 class I SAM-dependent methyltransferase [Myxococcales bacterium]